MLRGAERLVPVVDGNDINVPKVNISHDDPPKKALTARFFAEELSCIFTSEMIQKYYKLNQEFAARMKEKLWILQASFC